MKPKNRGGVTFETPHEESEGRKFGNHYKPQGQVLSLIDKGRPGEVPGLGGHLTIEQQQEALPNPAKEPIFAWRVVGYM